jgi:hypothetical protein
MPEPLTVVIFRRWRSGPRSVIAIFPEIDVGDHLVEMYEHVGQHAGGSYAKVIDSTRPASVEEPDVAALKAELEACGYVLRIRQRADLSKLGSMR